ncbi:MAG: thioredoxin-dependent thiol peroxidase [Alphaproteobacteria bacterium]
MTALKIGDAAPDFTLPTDGGGELTLSELRGKNVVLYFYPKDNTPGCTTESCDFRDAMPDFEKLDAEIIGVSKCSVKKHDNFKAKYNFNFPLASDENGNMCEDYGVWQEKTMMGKKYMGIVRSTFLINKDGKITNIWSPVKVKGHVDDVKTILSNQ